MIDELRLLLELDLSRPLLFAFVASRESVCGRLELELELGLAGRAC